MANLHSPQDTLLNLTFSDLNFDFSAVVNFLSSVIITSLIITTQKQMLYENVVRGIYYTIIM